MNHRENTRTKQSFFYPLSSAHFKVTLLDQVRYGGRVTDDFDKRLLCTFTNVWFSDALLHPGFKFYEGYPLPDHKTVEEYTDHIVNMPLQDIPEVFGLHSNADISYQVNCGLSYVSLHSIFISTIVIYSRSWIP